MATTHITDVTLRDAHQCLIATRLRTEDMLPVCKKWMRSVFGPWKSGAARLLMPVCVF